MLDLSSGDMLGEGESDEAECFEWDSIAPVISDLSQSPPEAAEETASAKPDVGVSAAKENINASGVGIAKG